MNRSPRRRPLKVGLQLPEAEYVAPWSSMLAMARLAEEAGFDSLWMGDHLLYEDGTGTVKGVWEAWSLLAALAAVTERIELGPLVACTGFHNPAMIAKKATTIDEISGGRFVLGLGAGWNEPEYRAFGFPYDHRVSRFEEAFTIIRTLLQDGFIDFHGTYYQAERCTLLPRGPRPGGIPLMIGSSRPRMLRIALPFVQSWNAWFADFDNRADKLPPILAGLDAACRDVGRDPATLERTCAILLAMGGAVGRSAAYRPDSPLRPHAGTTKELATVIRAFAAVGISHLQVVLDPITEAAIAEFAPVLELLDRGDVMEEG
ncbi:MAG: LLM class flavin-dependent oxidoreductase [Chloroflexota bacterium]|nr:LLM class flavin-dependent oxidoreductase [Chloroflexota bacterium]